MEFPLKTLKDVYTLYVHNYNNKAESFIKINGIKYHDKTDKMETFESFCEESIEYYKEIREKCDNPYNTHWMSYFGCNHPHNVLCGCIEPIF